MPAIVESSPLEIAEATSVAYLFLFATELSSVASENRLLLMSGR